MLTATAAMWAFGFAVMPGAGVAAQAGKTNATTKDPIQCCHKCKENPLKFESFGAHCDYWNWNKTDQLGVPSYCARIYDPKGTCHTHALLEGWEHDLERFAPSKKIKFLDVEKTEEVKHEISKFLNKGDTKGGQDEDTAQTNSNAIRYIVGAAQLEAAALKIPDPTHRKECEKILHHCIVKSGTKNQLDTNHAYGGAHWSKTHIQTEVQKYRRMCVMLRKKELELLTEEMNTAIKDANKEDMTELSKVCESEARQDLIDQIKEDLSTNFSTALKNYKHQCGELKKELCSEVVGEVKSINELTTVLPDDHTGVVNNVVDGLVGAYNTNCLEEGLDTYDKEVEKLVSQASTYETDRLPAGWGYHIKAHDDILTKFQDKLPKGQWKERVLAVRRPLMSHVVKKIKEMCQSVLAEVKNELEGLKANSVAVVIEALTKISKGGCDEEANSAIHLYMNQALHAQDQAQIDAHVAILGKIPKELVDKQVAQEVQGMLKNKLKAMHKHKERHNSARRSMLRVLRRVIRRVLAAQ